MNKEKYIFHLMGFILPSEVFSCAVSVENVLIYIPTYNKCYIISLQWLANTTLVWLILELNDICHIYHTSPTMISSSERLWWGQTTDKTTKKYICHYPWLKQHEITCNNTTALNLWVWKYLWGGVLSAKAAVLVIWILSTWLQIKVMQMQPFSPCYSKDVKQQDTFALKLNKKKKGFWSSTVHIHFHPPHQLLLPRCLWSVKQMDCEK